MRSFRFFQSIAAFSLVIILLGSCNNNEPTGFSALDNHYSKQSQTFTVNASVNSTLRGNEGTIINIPANSFYGPNGIVSGNVTVNLTEIYDNNEMLLNNKPTVASGSLLRSGGVVNITATQDGIQLYLANYISVLFPTANTSASPVAEMLPFYWAQNDSLPEMYETWTWSGDSSDVNNGWTYDSSATSGWYYELYVNNLNWINCDAFYDQGPMSIIQAIAPSGYNESNTRVYTIFTGINSVYRMYYGWCTPDAFCASNIPVGMTYAIAAIHYDQPSNSFSSCILTNQTVGSGGSLHSLTFSSTTIDDFELAVMGL